MSDSDYRALVAMRPWAIAALIAVAVPIGGAAVAALVSASAQEQKVESLEADVEDVETDLKEYRGDVVTLKTDVGIIKVQLTNISDMMKAEHKGE